MNIIATTKIYNGRVYLPKEVRKKLKLKDGDRIIVSINTQNQIVLDKNREEKKIKTNVYTSD
jgi:AbrB family looped-hinge helix DNA binding protein